MKRAAFRKTLSSNDVGETGGHQGGILIPKGESDLLAFLPYLNPSVKNPDAWLACMDENGDIYQFRFVHYNNKLHDENGTRNEYRITHMTAWFRRCGARTGDVFEISQDETQTTYRIRIVRSDNETEKEQSSSPTRIRLRGWRRVH